MASANLAQLRTGTADGSALFQQLLERKFDPDAWHVMQERDDSLIRDELLHGNASKAFVYSFEITGKKVEGVSVIGARELASQYKGIKSRIVATVEKRGSLFIFRSFSPLNIETRVLPELESEDDFYECIAEVSDIKTGNSIEVRKKESKREKKRNGEYFDRPHYDVIAESKAFRNGVLSVLPQSVIRDFMKRCLAAGNTSNEQTIDQRRAAASTYATKYGIALNRKELGELSYAELDGLGAAAAAGIHAFRQSAVALGLVAEETGEVPPPPPAPAAPAPRAPSAAAPRTEAAPVARSDEWQPSPEEEEEIRRRELEEAQADQQRAAAPAAAAPARRSRGAAVQQAID